jgi:hypothetical protein
LRFESSLSEGSHHPEWFGAVIDDFVAEIEDPRRRGRNLAEAALCVQLTALAYESSARGGVPLEIPAPAPTPPAAGAATPRNGSRGH